MPWPAIIAAGASIWGASQLNKNSSDIASTTNALNAQQFNEQMGFNAQQSDINRAFNAQQASEARAWSSGEADKSRAFNREEASTARQFNSAEAEKSRDYLTTMSNTEHQRAVKDLRAAGLNPILAAGGGNNVSNSPSASGPAASSGIPSGAQASSSAASMSGAGTYQQHQIVDPIGQAINSGASLYEKTNQIAKINAETSKIKEETRQIGAQFGLTKAQTDNVTYQSALLLEQSLKTRRESTAIGLENEVNTILTEFMTSNKFILYADKIGIEKAALGGAFKAIMQTLLKRGKK